MLVLSRKLGASIVIDNRITVTVTDIDGDTIRLGIEAPREVPVHRKEVQDRLNGEQDGAGAPSNG